MSSLGGAPAVFKEIIRDRWTPAFREMGFVGSGRVFVLPDPQDWAMLGIQGSTASTSECVKFTLNLLVVGKDQWTAARSRISYIGAKPTPNAIGPHRYEERIGGLLSGQDQWWQVYPSEDPGPLVEEIIQIVRIVAVPKLRAEMADKTPGPRGTFATVNRGA